MSREFRKWLKGRMNAARLTPNEVRELLDWMSSRAEGDDAMVETLFQASSDSEEESFQHIQTLNSRNGKYRLTEKEMSELLSNWLGKSKQSSVDLSSKEVQDWLQYRIDKANLSQSELEELASWLEEREEYNRNQSEKISVREIGELVTWMTGRVGSMIFKDDRHR